jgi:hypothetical protein
VAELFDDVFHALEAPVVPFAICLVASLCKGHRDEVGHVQGIFPRHDAPLLCLTPIDYLLLGFVETDEVLLVRLPDLLGTEVFGLRVL